MLHPLSQCRLTAHFLSVLDKHGILCFRKFTAQEGHGDYNSSPSDNNFWRFYFSLISKNNMTISLEIVYFLFINDIYSLFSFLFPFKNQEA